MTFNLVMQNKKLLAKTTAKTQNILYQSFRVYCDILVTLLYAVNRARNKKIYNL